MIDWLVEPWTFPFMRWALGCCLVLAGIHAYLGFHVVRRGVLFVDLAMAQMAALGAAIGVVLGLEHGTWGEYAISAAFALFAAGVFSVLRSRRVNQEAIIAVFYAVAMALTFIVLEHSPHGMDEVRHLLVGQILTVDPARVIWTALFYAGAGVTLSFVHATVLAATENPEAPRSAFVEFLFFAVFALVVTSSVSLVGVLLVFALLVIPSVAALLRGRGTWASLGFGWALAGLGAFAGLQAAFHLDLPAAPVVVLALGALLFFVALVWRARP